MFRERQDRSPLGPDLHTQLEDLLNVVWAAEANWRLDDRIDLATSVQLLEQPED